MSRWAATIYATLGDACDCAARVSSVGVVTALLAGRSGVRFAAKWRFLLLKPSRPVEPPTQPPVQWIPGIYFDGVRHPGREVEQFHIVPRVRMGEAVPLPPHVPQRRGHWRFWLTLLALSARRDISRAEYRAQLPMCSVDRWLATSSNSRRLPTMEARVVSRGSPWGFGGGSGACPSVWGFPCQVFQYRTLFLLDSGPGGGRTCSCSVLASYRHVAEGRGHVT